MSTVPRQAKISMHLRPPQVWWAYLGLRSNPSIPHLLDGCDRVLVFDNPDRLPGDHANRRVRTKYLLICWDGLLDRHPIDEVRRAIGERADLWVYVVGHYSPVSDEDIHIQALYPAGPLDFSAAPVTFDLRTNAMLLLARARGYVRPLRNILQKNSNPLREIDLLCGKRKIVFCGSYGMSREIVGMLSNRYGGDSSIFEPFDFYRDYPNASFENYKEYLRRYSVFLAGLLDSTSIDPLFFMTAVRLLGRQYFIERIRYAGLPIYSNKFAGGSYVDVYSTPFYSQHIFLDFGSVVGSGNYPRLADLTYFKKKFVEIDLDHNIGELLDLARRESLELLYEQEWNRKSPRLLQPMK